MCFIGGGSAFSPAINAALLQHLACTCLEPLCRPRRKRPDKAPPNPGNETIYRRVCTHLAENLAGSPDSMEISRQIGVSVRHINRVFRARGEESPYRYLTRLRIAKAQERIREDPCCPLKTVAAECGFSSPSHFSVAFKRETGQRPADFLRKQKSHADPA